MGPTITLDGATLRANVATFAALGAPVAAVVKSDGYGWGARRLARELDGVVESYVVADDEELAALRPATNKPIRLLADAPPGRLEAVLALRGIPNVSSRESLAEASAVAARRDGLTVRIGIVDATGWSAISPRDAAEFAAAVAGTGLRVELWTHVTSAPRSPAILSDFAAAREAFVAAGVPLAGIDVASTASASAATAYDRLRIGAGLFGARLGNELALRCALRVTAPVVRVLAPGEQAWAGYGERAIATHETCVVLRCGYGDGFPKGLAGRGNILAVGMQYTTRVITDGSSPCLFIGADDDVDALAAQAGISPHELVVGLARS